MKRFAENKIVRMHHSAPRIVDALEKREGRSLLWKHGANVYEPDEFVISLSGKPNWVRKWADWSWPGQLEFHELGHAVFDVYGSKFDRTRFKQIFGGSFARKYTRPWLHLLRDPKGVARRSAASIYAKHHPEEAWAEAFSFALAGINERYESSDVINQLAYADWVIDNIISGRRRWGSFQGSSEEGECWKCHNDFRFDTRRESDTTGWELECPNSKCRATMIVMRT